MDPSDPLRTPEACQAVGCLRHGLSPPQGLMAIPVSTFVSVPHQKFFDHYIRFCFVKVKDRPGEGRAPQASSDLLGRGIGLICVGAG